MPSRHKTIVRTSPLVESRIRVHQAAVAAARAALEDPNLTNKERARLEFTLNARIASIERLRTLERRRTA